MAERRQYARIGVSIPVKYKSASSRIWSETFTLNISAGGVLMATTDELKIGDELKMQVLLPAEKKPIEATGKVVWKKPTGELSEFDAKNINAKSFAGIEFAKFTKIDEDNTIKIMAFVYEHLHETQSKKKKR